MALNYLWSLCRLFETLNLIKVHVPSLHQSILPHVARQIAHYLFSTNPPLNATYRICLHFPRYSTHATSIIESLTREVHPWFWSLTTSPSTQDTIRLLPSYNLLFTKLDPIFTGKIYYLL